MSGESLRESKHALLRGDPAAAEKTARLLAELGVEERKDAEVEAEHRAVFLAATRAYAEGVGQPGPAPPVARLCRAPGRILWPGHPLEDTMSTRADHGHELIPRPEQTPDALRAALAVIDPSRLEEMQSTKDDAFAKAVEWQSLSPVRSWVLTWARDIEIARRPDLSDRHAHAKSNLENDDPVLAQEALRELSAVLDEAMKAVRE